MDSGDFTSACYGGERKPKLCGRKGTTNSCHQKNLEQFTINVVYSDKESRNLSETSARKWPA